MPDLRSMTLLGLTFVFAVSVPASCSTNAVGVEECRRIEYARCEAAVHCPDTFDVDNVESCKRFYRDQCLHGLDLDETPSKSEVTACVEAIGRLGTCAKTGGEEALVSECAEVSSTDETVDLVCELIERPEVAPECAFLIEDDDDGEGGAGGEAGSGGASGESSGGNGGAE